MSEISKEYLEKELAFLNDELQRAGTFVIQVQTGIALFKNLLVKIDESEEKDNSKEVEKPK